MESFTAGEEDEAGRRTSDVAPGQESVETFHRPTLTLHNNPSRNVFSVFITKKKKKRPGTALMNILVNHYELDFVYFLEVRLGFQAAERPILQLATRHANIGD